MLPACGGRCGRRRLAEWRFVPRCGRPERATTAGRVSVRQERFGLCPRSDERAWPEVRRARASRVEPTEYTEHVLQGALGRGGAGPAGACLAVKPPPDFGRCLFSACCRVIQRQRVREKSRERRMVTPTIGACQRQERR